MFRRIVLFLLLPIGIWARSFTVLVYNVENLHDIDGVAAYDDYQPDRYNRNHLLVKVENTASVIAKFNKGVGPDVILFQEIEVDHTPPSEGVFDMDKFLKQYEKTTLKRMLGEEFNMDIADLPAEAFLMKALADRGITGYKVISGNDRSSGGVFLKSVKCVTLSRFPVKEVNNFPIPNARNILETVLDIDGYPFHVFNNHWKSGASDAKMERIRVEGAKVLRKRIDEILDQNPFADIVMGGDFNSQYNQKRLYNQKRRKGSAGHMEVTAINDVLGAQGSLLRVRGEGSDLYNLWFELSEGQRGSDIYSGSWGTLMQMIISRGLFDMYGIQYIPGSFGVAKFPGLNMTELGEPYTWENDGNTGRGFSDHFPIYAHFRTVDDNKPGQYLPFTQNFGDKGDGQGEEDQARAYAAKDVRSIAITSDKIPADANLRDGTWNGKIFLVEGPITVYGSSPIRITFRNESYEVFIYDEKLRRKIRETSRNAAKAGRPKVQLKFYGELTLNRGKWRFTAKSAEWVVQ